MYSTMSLRISLALFKNFCSPKSHFVHRASLHLVPKHQLSSSEDLQPFPKHMKSLVHQSVDEILSTVKSESVSESVTTLKALRMLTIFKNVNANSFKGDPRFKMLCNVFERNCNIMHPNLLVSGLRSLLEVGVPPTSSCVTCAEQSIMNNVNLFSTFNIIGCLYFHYKFVETDLQKQVVLLLIRELSNRISEIKSSAELLMLVHFLHVFGEEDLKKIQQKIVELIPRLNVHEMCKVFVALAENLCRNILILNSLSFHFRQKEEVPQMKEILDVFYAFKRLNFFDINLISFLLSKMVPEISSIEKPSIVSGILTSCGYLKLKHPAVLDGCAEWIHRHVEACTPKEWVSFILTTAALNHHSPEMQKALQTILPSINYETIKAPNIWLDVVWSLAVLNIVDKEMLVHVLSPDFYKPLIEGSDFQTALNKLKLMNLKAVLKRSYPEYVFKSDLHLEPVEVAHSTEVQNGRKHVLNILSNFIPRDKYLSSNQCTNMGIYIDAEFIVNQSLKALPLSEFGVLSKVSDIKPLPKGAQRIALIILHFKDFTLLNPSKIGFVDFATKLLHSEGYTPALIPFDEFMRNNTEVKKTKYLIQKISSIMKKMEDNDFKYSAKLFN